MRKIEKSEYVNYISWARENSANRVYPCSIAEGYQTGDIYVNNGADVESVFFWHFCGFGYLSGKASDKMLSDIYAEMLSPHPVRRLVLITTNAEAIAFFRGRDVRMAERAEYAYQPQGKTVAANPFPIERIDAENISRIEGKIVPSFSWESPEQFLRESFGYVALDRGNVCAAAFAAAVSSEEVDIGVETQEKYRRMGLAAILANKMCEHILSIGKRPVWAHAVTNTGSMRTALKCGFVKDRVSLMIRTGAVR